MVAIKSLKCIMLLFASFILCARRSRTVSHLSSRVVMELILKSVICDFELALDVNQKCFLYFGVVMEHSIGGIGKLK